MMMMTSASAYAVTSASEAKNADALERVVNIDASPAFPGRRFFIGMRVLLRQLASDLRVIRPWVPPI